MRCEKPVTENMAEKANALYRLLKSANEYLTKEEIGEALGIKNERSVRDVVALLATRRPIISHSGNKGYKLALTEADKDEVRRCWAELSSRMEELEKRIQPLIVFLEK